jgi:hypothetical protein
VNAQSNKPTSSKSDDDSQTLLSEHFQNNDLISKTGLIKSGSGNWMLKNAEIAKNSDVTGRLNSVKIYSKGALSMQFDVKVKRYYSFYFDCKAYGNLFGSRWVFSESYDGGKSYHKPLIVKAKTEFERKVVGGWHTGKVRFKIKSLSDEKSWISISNINLETARN